MDITFPSVESANNYLKTQCAWLVLEERGQKLSLRGTLPPRADSLKTKPYQQRIPLSVKNSNEGRKTAVSKAMGLSRLLDAELFDWRYVDARSIPSPDDIKEDDPVIEDIDRFFREFRAFVLAQRGQATWDKAYAPYLRKIFRFLEPGEGIKGACRSAVLLYSTASRGRQVCLTAVRAMYEFLGAQIPASIDSLANTYSHTDVDPRDLPTSDQIVAVWSRIPNPLWRNAYALMALFGLRNHEVFKCHMEWHGSRLFCHVHEGTKTGPRIAFADPNEWVKTFEVSVDMPLPDIRVYGVANQRIGQRVSTQFKRYDVGFSPYDLRHAYACRTLLHHADVLVAKSMGHSVEALNKIYRKHLSDNDFFKMVG